MSNRLSLSISSQSSVHQSLAEDLAMWRNLEVDCVGLISPKLEATGWQMSQKLILDSGLYVSNVVSEGHLLFESLHLAAAIGAPTVYTCTGPLGQRSWQEAATDFGSRVKPFVKVGRQLGVCLAVEPTNPLWSDISFVHSLRDAIHLSEATGVGVVADLYSCWYERDLVELVQRNIEAIALVQVCDYKVGTHETASRLVPGDGDLPVASLVSTFVQSGYEGPFDLEIHGPAIEIEGYANAIRRSIERMRAFLRQAESDAGS